MLFRRTCLVLLFSFIFLSSAHAVWIWTPQTGKFINPKWSVKSTPKQQLEYGLAYYQGKKYGEAINEFKKLIKHYPRAKEAPEAQYYIGRAFEDLNKPYEAYKAYQVVIDKYPFSERAAEIIELQYKIGNQILEGKAKRGKLAEAFSGEDRVTEIFKTVIKNAPYGKLAPIAQYKIGLYLKEKGLYNEARDEFEKTMNDYPNSDWAKAAQFQIAMADTKRSANAQHEQKTTRIAIEGFNEFVKSHPDSQLTPQAKDQIAQLRNKESENAFVVAQYYEKQKNYKSAKIYYNEIINKYADTKFAPKALMRLKVLGGDI